MMSHMASEMNKKDKVEEIDDIKDTDEETEEEEEDIDRFLRFCNNFEKGLEPIFQEYGAESIKIDAELVEDCEIDGHLGFEWVPTVPFSDEVQTLDLPKIPKGLRISFPPSPATGIETYNKLIIRMEEDLSECIRNKLRYGSEGEEDDDSDCEGDYCTYPLYYPLPKEYHNVPIYAVVSYPTSQEGVFKVTLNKHTPYTYASLWYVHAAAYRLVYRLEEMCTSGAIGTISGACMNRQTTCGPFGIWGHDICDLVYNGFYNIYGVPGRYLVCDLSCDS